MHCHGIDCAVIGPATLSVLPNVVGDAIVEEMDAGRAGADDCGLASDPVATGDGDVGASLRPHPNAHTIIAADANTRNVIMIFPAETEVLGITAPDTAGRSCLGSPS